MLKRNEWQESDMDKQMLELIEYLKWVTERHLCLEGVAQTRLEEELEQVLHEKSLEVE